MVFNLDELDLIDPEKETWAKPIGLVEQPDKMQNSKQTEVKDFNKALQDFSNKNAQIKSAYDLARETYEKDQINPAAAFIESYKPVRNEEKEARLKKTAAINSIGQALTNVIDAAYGKRGAYIPVRNNNSTAGILNTLSQEEGQYKQDLDKYNNLKLSQMIQDLNLERAEQKAEKDWGLRNKLQEDRFTGETNLENLRFNNDLLIEQERNKGKENVATINKDSRVKVETIKNSKNEDKPFFVVSDKKNLDENGSPRKLGMDENLFWDVVVETSKYDPEIAQASLNYQKKPTNTSLNYLKKIVTDKWDKIYSVTDDGRFSLRDNKAPTTQGYEDIYKKDTQDPLGLGGRKQEDDPLGLF